MIDVGPSSHAKEFSITHHSSLVPRSGKTGGSDANDAADIGAGHHAFHLPDAFDTLCRIFDGRKDRCEVRFIELLNQGAMTCHLLQNLE